MSAAVTTLQIGALVVLVALMAAAVLSDLRDRRIPNKLVAVGLLLGLGSQVLAPLPGIDGGFSSGLLGAVAALGLFLPFYAFRTMGAGDVKLLAMACAWLGLGSVLWAGLFTLAAGGALALGVAIATGAVRRVLQNLWFMLAATSMRLQGVPTVIPVSTTGRLPYAVAIAVGTACELCRRSGLLLIG